MYEKLDMTIQTTKYDFVLWKCTNVDNIKRRGPFAVVRPRPCLLRLEIRILYVGVIKISAKLLFVQQNKVIFIFSNIVAKDYYKKLSELNTVFERQRLDLLVY